jgi:RNA ligase
LNNLGSELRGLTIVEDTTVQNKNNQKIFLSIPKFFNINEVPETQENVLKTKVIKKVQEKLDGSLIQPVQICGEIKMKSKQSFDNSQAELAQNILEFDPELEFFILDCWDNDFYPLFELVGPDNRVVLDYNKNELVLIAVRTKTGEFIDIDKFNYKRRAKSYTKTLDELIHSAKNDKNIEGYVVKFTDGSVVKIKTLDYLEKHKITDESNSYKILLKRILQEDMDDVYTVINPERLDEIRKIEKKVQDYVLHYITEIQEIIKENHSISDRKSFVNKHINHKYFSVIMSSLKGHDIKEALIDYLLRKYSKEAKAKEFIESL